MTDKGAEPQSVGRVKTLLHGQGLAAKAMRGGALTILGFGGSQALRFASNLILTRILFPEAFGVMALVYVFMQGLNNFSDVGITPAIMRSKRGDDPDFLNTAWTMQIIRGFTLWMVTFIIAAPAAQFFNASLLEQILPVIGVTLFISGFNPTRLDTANRHLNFGRITVIELIAQIIALIVAIVAAIILESVWAFVISGIVGSFVHLILLTFFLPGEHNKFRWERESSKELINFGKWVFLSTAAGFFISQGDKIILGKYLSISTLGIYNIGFFLAGFPLLLGGTVTRRILIPLYRERPPKESRENFLKLRKMRFALSAALLGALGVLAMLSGWLIDVLYDPRYIAAGGILLLVTFAQLPSLIVLTYDQAALASGDSKRFFVLAFARMIFLIAGLWIGVVTYGLAGALIGQAIGMVAVYPVVVWLARHQGAWDPLHDLTFAILGASILAVAFWLNFGFVTEILALNSP
ncbi:oligosaccharide flippase family protein [Cognatishimia activa]|uniref:oligosaccharide flippase family protein n=1 Tax=Cognatishimia activa TaxID=1715691 RepID=UPI00222E3A29|nr:oligosaccharide flippase family protein [Cognatishimia activa]UZD91693.1 oligosaccharide flippase family protein [Cognatishimia activa]